MPGPVHGRRTHFSLDDDNGAPVDISSYLNNVQFQEQGETVDTTRFHPTNKRKTFLVGFVEGTIQLSGFWDEVIDAHLAAVLASDESLTFVYGPKGSTQGFPRRTGECFLMSAPITSAVNGAVVFTCELKIDGEVTVDTFPT